MTIRPWWFYGGALVAIAGILVMGVIVDRTRRQLAQTIEWAHGVDPIVKAVERDFYTGPDEPPTAPIADVVDKDLRRVLEEAADKPSDDWRQRFSFRDVTDQAG